MGPIARNFGRRLATGCLIKLISTVLVVGCVTIGGCASLVLPVPASSDRGMLFMFMLILSMSVAIALALSGVGLLLWKRSSHTDAAFVPHGLRGSAYVQGGRQYHGAVNGREVAAFVSYHGPRFELEVVSSMATRLAIGTSNALGKVIQNAFQLQTIDLSYDPAFQGMVASGSDDAWIRWLLQQPQPRELLATLARQATASEMRVVMVAPGKVGIAVNFIDVDVVTPAQVQSWIQQLIQLTALLESMPQPHQRLEPSSLERMAHSIKGSTSGMRKVALGFAALTALMMGFAGFVGVVLVMTGNL